MEIRENSQKKVLLSVLGVAILVVAVIGISFAAYSVTKYSNENTITTGTLMVSYQEDTTAINITDAMPMSDEEALKDGVLAEDNESFVFTVSTKATDALTVPYTISLTPTAGNTLTNAQVRIYLTKNDVVVAGYPKAVSDCTSITQGNRAGSFLLTTGEDVFTAGNTATTSTEYELKMWVDKTVDVSADQPQRSYSATVNVDSAVTPIGQ